MATHSLVPRLLLAAAVLSSGAAFAGPNAPLPKDLPAYAPDRPLPVPEIAQKTLANGMTILVVPRNGLPRVDYVLALRNAGYGADAPTAAGFAAMLADLLTEGTARHDSKSLAETADSYGGAIGATAGNDGITLSANALRSRAEPMIGLLAEVARSASFPDGEVQLAKANALQVLKASEAQPGFRATRALLAAIYGDHPYSRVQYTEASLRAIEPAPLRAEHARRFRPDRALLIVTGRVSAEEGFRWAESAFGDWKNQGTPAPESAVIAATAPVRRIVLERPGSVQSTIRLGRPAIAATHPDYVPLVLAGTVLGGGFSSRVNQNLREAKGYTYGAFAFLAAARFGGGIQGGADVRNEVTGASLKEFEFEFRRVGEEPVPAQELEDTKRYVAGGYLISNQLQAAVAATLANYWLMGLPIDFLGQYVPKIRAVTAAEVQAVAKKYLTPTDLSMVIVGDSKAIAEQLKAFGTFEVRDK